MKIETALMTAAGVGIPVCSVLTGLVYINFGPFAAMLVAGMNFWFGSVANMLITNHYLSKVTNGTLSS